MNKNVFTPDGGPHRTSRVLDVSEGLKRIGEFEAAEMLAGYAALLRDRESAKAGVTDKIVYRACKAGRITRDEPPEHELAAMRRKLEAVTPMLASARVLEAELTALKNIAHDMRWQAGNNNRLTHIGWAQRVERVISMLAAAPKPEKE